MNQTLTKQTYSHIPNYDLLKLSDKEKKTIFDSICSFYDDVAELELDGKEVDWINNNLSDWLDGVSYDEIFVATIYFKDSVTDEFLSKFEGCDLTYRVNYEEKAVKFLPRFDGLIFPNDANLADFYKAVPFDLTQIDYFQLSDS